MIEFDGTNYAKAMGSMRDALRKQYQVRLDKVVQRFADDVRRTVQRKIKNRQVGGPKLTKDWWKDKRRRSKDTRRLIETGEMLRQVNVAAGRRGEDEIKFVIFSFSGASLRGAPEDLPFFHEEGTKGKHAVPARPVWRPALAEAKATSSAYKSIKTGKWLVFRSPHPR
jgi:hypothetical protein